MHSDFFQKFRSEGNIWHVYMYMYVCIYIYIYIYLFICGLFNDAIKECIINWWPNLNLCLNICMEGL